MSQHYIILPARGSNKFRTYEQLKKIAKQQKKGGNAYGKIKKKEIDR